MSWVRARSAAVLVAGALAVSLMSTGAAQADPGEPCVDGGGRYDIDGGGGDVVIGLPSYDVEVDGTLRPDAGAIVIYSNVFVDGVPQKPTATRLLSAGDLGLPVQEDARFGAAIWATGPDEPDFEGCGHLLIGAPGQDVDGLAGAGAAHFIDGFADGLRHSWSLDQRDLRATASAPQAGAAFGAVIAGGGPASAVVGVPGRDVDMDTDAGGVATVSFNDKEGYGWVGDWVPGLHEGDRLGGGPLAAGRAHTGHGWISTVAAGVPSADVGDHKDAGAVMVRTRQGDNETTRWITQDSPGAGGSAEAGDQYGAALSLWRDDLDSGSHTIAVGVPGEDVGTAGDAGLVSYVTIADETTVPVAAETTLTQNSAGVSGVVEPGDRFGSAVQLGTVDGPDGGRLLVGAEGEAVGTATGAGALTVNPVDRDWLRPVGTGRGWTQETSGVPGTPEPGDHFGAVVATFPRTVVLSPGEDIGTASDAGRATFGPFHQTGTKIDLAIPGTQADSGDDMVAATYSPGW